MVIFFIPPMGHQHSYYHLLKDPSYIFLDYPKNINNLEDIAQELSSHIKSILAQDSKNQRFCLAGTSLGASLCLRINEILNNEATKLFLIATGGPQVSRIRKIFIEDAAKNMTPHSFLEKILALTSEETFLDHFSANKDKASVYFHQLKTCWQKNEEDQVHNFHQLSLNATAINYEDLMKRYEDKIVIIWGLKDKVFSKRNLSLIQKIIPNAKYHIKEELGHYMALEQPEFITNTVRLYV